MTQRDRWQERKPVIKYRAWCDEARKAAGLAEMQKIEADGFFGVIAFAHFRMPKSYSQKKRDELAGRMCGMKPDVDNILKALCDALFENDERIVLMQCFKYWAYDDEDPRVDVFLLPKDESCGK